MAGYKMERCSSNFKPDLEGFDLPTIESDPSTIFGLDPDLNLTYFNKAWFSFAAENNGEPAISNKFPVGTPLDSAISEPLKQFYKRMFRRVLQIGVAWSHEYECSSDELYRFYRQTAYPFHNRKGLIVVNSLSVCEPVNEQNKSEASAASAKLYFQDSGFVTQCGHCRRTQRANEPRVWDWVPALLKLHENVSHSLCPVCFDYYFKHNASRRKLMQEADIPDN